MKKFKKQLNRFNVDSGKLKKIIISLFLILIGFGFRLIPHVPNFTPVLAISLFAGFYFSRKVALFLPLAIMVASDIFIGYYELSLMIAVYLSLGIAVLLGGLLKKESGWLSIGTNTLISAVLFFLLTNFAVWVFTPWYSKTVFGLIKCYILAIPFFKGTLLGTIFYSGLLFGSYKVLVRSNAFRHLAKLRKILT